MMLCRAGRLFMAPVVGQRCMVYSVAYRRADPLVHVYATQLGIFGALMMRHLYIGVMWK